VRIRRHSVSKNAEHLIGDDRLGGALVKSSAADTGPE